MIIKHMGMIADLIAKHHGIDHIDYEEGSLFLYCRADNQDQLDHAISAFKEYGLVTSTVIDFDKSSDGKSYLEVRLVDTMRSVSR